MTSNLPAKGEEDEDDMADDKNKNDIELPPSWVQPMTITRARFESKFPVGYKCMNYRNLKHVSRH